MRDRDRFFAVSAVLLSFVSRTSAVQAQRIGPEFQVNSYTSHHQVAPIATAFENGGFLVVWTSLDGPTMEVQGRIFDASGTPLDGEFQVNVSTTRDELARGVAVDGNGSFLVIWEAFDEIDQIVRARAFDVTGAPLGGEFVIHADTSALFFQPDVAAVAAGEFIVAWQNNGRDSVWARLVGTTMPLGPAFQVNSYATGEHDYPAVSGDGNGGFVVSWASHRPGGGPSRIFAQRFDADGVPQGDELQVSTVTTDAEWNTDITAIPGGGFVVAWESWNRDSSPAGVFARRFDETGTPAGGDFRVETYDTTVQRYPAVSSAANGDFLVVWSSDSQDGSETGVFGQHFDSEGSRLGDEFQVNTYTLGAQAEGVVAGLSTGGFVAAWSSMEQDGSGSGVFGQRIEIRCFADGFESGDGCAWSVVTGGGTCP